MAAASHCPECGSKLRDVIFCPQCGQASCCWECFKEHFTRHRANLRSYRPAHPELLQSYGQDKKNGKGVPPKEKA